MTIDEHDPYAAAGLDDETGDSDIASISQEDDESPSTPTSTDVGEGEGVGEEPGEPDTSAAPAARRSLPVWVWIAGGMAGLVAVAGVLTVVHPGAAPASPGPAMARPEPHPTLPQAQTPPPAASSSTPFVMGSPSTSPPAASAAPAATPTPASSSSPLMSAPAAAPQATPAPKGLALAAPTTDMTAPPAASVQPVVAHKSAPASAPIGQALAKILAHIQAIQSSLRQFAHTTAPASSALVLRLREQRDRAWHEIRALDHSREVMLHEIVRLRKREDHRAPTSSAVPPPPPAPAPTATPGQSGTPWAGWRLAGLSSQAVILRNAQGGIKIIQPGQSFRGVRILTINAAQRLLMTNEGPIVLPPRT